MKHVALCTGLLLLAVPLYAEVMDKEPTITAIWLYAVIGGCVALLAWRFRWWLGVLVSVPWMYGLWGTYREIADPVIGPAIRAEAGDGYVTQYYLSVVAALALQSGAFLIAWRKRSIAH